MIVKCTWHVYESAVGPSSGLDPHKWEYFWVHESSPVENSAWWAHFIGFWTAAGCGSSDDGFKCWFLQMGILALFYMRSRWWKLLICFSSLSLWGYIRLQTISSFILWKCMFGYFGCWFLLLIIFLFVSFQVSLWIIIENFGGTSEFITNLTSLIGWEQRKRTSWTECVFF